MAYRVVGTFFVVALLAGGGYYLTYQEDVLCDLCGRHLHQEVSYKIHLSSGEVLYACCPRCGLNAQKGKDDVVATEVADFTTSELFPAEEAYFVEGSRVQLCRHDESESGRDQTGILYTMVWDRCLPSLVAFRTHEEAEQFRGQNGGQIKTYAQLL